MKAVVWILLSTLFGCSLWVPVGGKYVSHEYLFEVDLPERWSRTPFARNGITMTRDGFSLQVVQITRAPFDVELPFTKRRVDKGMLPQEVAEIIIDNIRSNPNISTFQVTENHPATVGGYPGFKIAYSYSTRENLKKRGVYFGVLADQWLYKIVLEAPARHYFPRDVVAVERMKETFKINL